MADAVELDVNTAWFIGDAVGAGTFPWVLAITPPYRDISERAAFGAQQSAELSRLGVMTGTEINPAVQQWIRTVCHPERWLELRFVGSAASSGDLLRGIVARRGGQTVVALRSAQRVTFTEVDVDDPRSLVPVVTVGLSDRVPARFDQFTLPAGAGARADKRIRDGAEPSGVMDYLGVPVSARDVVRAALDGPRSYVEVVAGQRRDAAEQTTEVGVAVVDTTAGRVVVSPSRAFDGGWVSTFAPGTVLATAAALDGLCGLLPDGRWFPAARPAREFVTQGS